MKTFEEWCQDREVVINELSPKFLTMAYKIWGEECFYEAKKYEAENAHLREVEDKEVEFPVSFGDRIYTINFQKPKAQWKVNCGIVKTISLTQTPDRTRIVFRIKVKYRNGKEYVFGKNAFLSKEEAEARLAEMKGGEE